MIRIAASFLLLACVVFSQALLDDMTVSRSVPNNALWLPAGEGDTAVIPYNDGGNSRLRIYVVADKRTGVTGEVYGLNLLFFPYNAGWTAPTGFTKHYIKSGSWSSTYNRMEFYVRCSYTEVYSAGDSIYKTSNVGTYVKHPSYQGSPQGQHYYHFIHTNVYANRWKKVALGWSPTHLVASPPGVSPSVDPEFNAPTTGTPVHYFDGMTSWYFITNTDGLAPYTCDFDNVRFVTTPGTSPDVRVRNMSAIYTGSKYEVGWDTEKTVGPLTFEIRYSTSSMKVNGWSSGTSGGTKVKQNDGGFSGVRWDSANMSESATGMYFAVHVQGDPTDTFAEIRLAPTPELDEGGGEPPPSGNPRLRFQGAPRTTGKPTIQ